RQRTDRLPILKSTQKIVGEKRWIEPDIFEHVVVNPVIHYSRTGSHNEFLRTKNIPCETSSGSKIVRVLVPQLVGTNLQGSGRNSRIKRGAHREERINAGCGRRCNRRPKIDVGVNSGLEVMRHAEVFPSQPEIDG